MAPYLIAAFFFFFSLTLLASCVHSQDSVAFSVDTFTPNPPELTYQGDAHVPTDSTFLRLTRTAVSGGRTVPQSWSVGRVLFSPTVLVSQSETSRQASFETTLRFKVTRSPAGAADGIAFFMGRRDSTIPDGATGGNLGIYRPSGPNYALFTVEFDAFSNPGVDPIYPHIGINLNSKISNATTPFLNIIGQVVTARIKYNANNKEISVVASTAAWTYRLSYVFDLSTILPDWVQVGVSSASGQHNNNLGIYDLLSWSFNCTLIGN